MFALMLVSLEASAQASGAASAVPSNTASNVEVQVLRAQLESMRFFHDSFISMAQWALGTAVAVILSLAVFGWFTNKASYERERDLLKQQAHQLKDEVMNLLQMRVIESRKELEAALNTRQAAIQKAVETAIQPKISAVQSAVKDANDAALELKADAALKEAKEAQGSKRHAWAIYKYCQALEIYVQRKTDFYEASDALDAINEILKTPGLTLDADAVSGAVESLQRLPKQHHAVTESLIKRLKIALA